MVQAAIWPSLGVIGLPLTVPSNQYHEFVGPTVAPTVETGTENPEPVPPMLDAEAESVSALRYPRPRAVRETPLTAPEEFTVTLATAPVPAPPVSGTPE